MAIDPKVAKMRAEQDAAFALKYPNFKTTHKTPESTERPARFTSITIGTNTDTQAKVVLPDVPRVGHMHVIGAPNTGKTTLLENMIRQDIANQKGVVVFDPHGNFNDSLYKNLLRWLHSIEFPGTRPHHAAFSRLHIVDLNLEAHVPGFNPLAQLPGADPAVIADAMLEAVERVWGDEDTLTKPTIRTVLKATFIALVERGWPLADAKLLLDADDAGGYRASTITLLKNEFARDELERIHELSLRKNRSEFDAQVVGPRNRLNEFVSSDATRNLFAQTDRVLDLLRIMDEGHVLLVNLQHGPKMSVANAELLGTVFLRYLFLLASMRAHYKRVYLYIDECHRFLSGDIPNILAEMRKFGLSCLLAHQFLGQLGKPHDPIYDAMLKCTEIKTVLRLNDPDEAQAFARFVIPLDLEMPVKALIRPTVIAHKIIELEGRSTSASEVAALADAISRGSADMSSSTLAFGSGTSLGHGLNQMMLGDPGTGGGGWLSVPDVLSHSISDTTGSMQMSTEAATRAFSNTFARTYTDSRAKGASQSQSIHQAFESVYAELPTAVHSRDNVLHMAGELIRGLSTGQAFFRYGNQGARVTIDRPKETKP